MLFLLLLVFFFLCGSSSARTILPLISLLKQSLESSKKRNVFATTLRLKYPEPFANVRVSLLSKLNENTQKECTATLKNTLRVACSWHCFPRRFDKEIQCIEILSYFSDFLSSISMNQTADIRVDLERYRGTIRSNGYDFSRNLSQHTMHIFN